MPTGKVKSMVLALLLAANLAFGGLLLYRMQQAARFEQDTLHQAIALLEEEAGLRMPQTLPAAMPLAPFVATRSAEDDLRFMESFLGASTAEDQGGGLVRYTSAAGDGHLRRNAAFDLLYHNSIRLENERPVELAARLLAAAGIEAQMLSAAPANDEPLVYQQLIDGTPILGYHIVFTFQRGELVTVSGYYVPPHRQTQAFAVEPLDMATLLTRFYAGLRHGSYLCRELSVVSVAYQSDSTGQFLPLWMLRTDTGVFYLDAMTGAMSTG
jgi:hypothetical protein